MKTAIDIWDGLRARPGRVGLSVLAIAIGLAALTVLLAVLGGLSDQSKRILSNLGANVFAVVQEGDHRRGEVLRQKHAELLRYNLPGYRIAGTREYAAAVPGRTDKLKVVAVDPELAVLRGWDLLQGRFLDELDSAQARRVAVITPALARNTGQGGAAGSDTAGWQVGDTIQLGRTAFSVVGMVRAGTSGGMEQTGASAALALGEQVVFVPSGTPPYWQSRGREWDKRIDMVFVNVPEEVPMAQGQAAVSSLLAQPDLALGQLGWITPERLLERVTRLQRTIKWTVGSIAVLCLILGGTTLMSLMVANVNERVTEIGLRRALGATPGDISSLFVLEACLVTALAALLGSGVTHAVLRATASRFPVPIRLGWDTLLLPLGVAVLLGMIFSWWPARTAARIAPSEALRNE